VGGVSFDIDRLVVEQSEPQPTVIGWNPITRMSRGHVGPELPRSERKIPPDCAHLQERVSALDSEPMCVRFDLGPN